jgi:hypothetical protein
MGKNNQNIFKTNKFRVYIIITAFLLIQIGVTLRILPQIWPFETTPMFSSVTYEGQTKNKYHILAVLENSTQIEIQPKELQSVICKPLDLNRYFLPHPSEKNSQNLQVKECKIKLILEFRNRRDFADWEHKIFVEALMENNLAIVRQYVKAYQQRYSRKVKSLQLLITPLTLTKDGYRESDKPQVVKILDIDI